jgi:SPP1 family predicted phage head-tail adaptor
MAKITAGMLDQRITFQSKSVTRNGIGEEVVTWADLVTLWAHVMPLRGGAFHAANQDQHTVDARFFIRDRAGLDESMRILWKTLPYDITNIIPGTGDYLGMIEITAVNGVKDGR